MDIVFELKKIIIIVLLSLFSIYSIQSTVLAGTSSQSLCEHGKALFKSGQFETARKTLSEAVKVDPNNAEGHYFLGYTLDRINRQAQQGTEEQDSWEKTDQLSKEFETACAVSKGDHYTGEVFLLSPRDKIMSLWSDLAICYLRNKNEEMALKAFDEVKKRGGFDPVNYHYIHTMLQSCPKYALLFTGGDMDTYYPIYIQFVERFRTDVSILNLYLLKEPWFLKMITESHAWQSTPVQLPFTTSQIINIEESAKAVKLPLTIHLLQSACGNQQNDMVLKIESAITGKNRNRMQTQDYVITSVLQSNKDRPVCVAATIVRIPFGYAMQLNSKPWNPHDNLEQNGLVYILSFCDTDTAQWIDVNRKILEEALQNPILPNSPTINDYGIITQDYIGWCIKIASRMDLLGKQNEARNLIRLFVSSVGGVRFLSNETQRSYLLGIAGQH